METNKSNTGKFYILNESTTEDLYFFNNAIGTSKEYISALQNSRQPIGHGQKKVAFNKAYIWKTLKDEFQVFQPNDDNGGAYGLINTVWTQPYASTPDMTDYTNEAVLGFNKQGKQGFYIITPLTKWLNNLFIGDKFNSVWPEDSYTGDNKKAYDYWLSLLESPPKKGNIPSSKINQIYNVPGYPANAKFSKLAFDNVYKQLSNECIYFEIAYKWFGTNGIIDAINTQIASVESSDLINAAGTMSMKPNDSTTLILETVISDFASIMTGIPKIGETISGILDISWSVAKLKLDDNENPNQEITTTIDKMADVLVNHLQILVNSTALQLNLLINDWGKLKEFGEAEMRGEISPEMLGMENTAYDPKVKPKLASGYIDVASRAWSTIIYKAINASVDEDQFYFYCKLVFYPDSCPENPWNPEKDIYNYTFCINCTANTTRGLKTGWLGIEFSYTAPKSMFRKLFGTDSNSLNIDPIEFFLQFNGWKISAAGGYWTPEVASWRYTIPSIG